jgi:hypothetical protein
LAKGIASCGLQARATFRETSFVETSFGETSFGEMSFGETSFGEMSFGESTLYHYNIDFRGPPRSLLGAVFQGAKIAVSSRPLTKDHCSSCGWEQCDQVVRSFVIKGETTGGVDTTSLFVQINL